MLGFLKRFKRDRIAMLVIAFLIVGLLALVLYLGAIRNLISRNRDLQSSASKVQVSENRLRAPSTDGLTPFVNAENVRAVSVLGGTTFLATSGGLIALDEAGNVSRRYTTFDGLPENDLTTLGVFRDRLFIGTSAAGLLSFDGQVFTRFNFTQPKATSVSVLAATRSELLIGTLDGGLFEYDGEIFSRRFNSASGADFSRITAILPVESRLYIGTQDRGLFIWREGHVEHISTSDGLPSPHVTGLAQLPSSLGDSDSVAVATDFGVIALTQQNESRSISVRPNVTSLAVSGSKLWGGLFGGGIVEFSAAEADEARGTQALEAIRAPGLPVNVPSRVVGMNERLWVLTDQGAFTRDENSTRPGFERLGPAPNSERLLTGNHITALAVDSDGRVWAGYFDRGVDVLSLDEAERVAHIEDTQIREVNSLAFDPQGDEMLVGTTAGLISIDRANRRTSFTREQTGLVSNSVAHVSFGRTTGAQAGSSTRGGGSLGKTLVIATAGGLTEIEASRARSITAFHGLASNHLYTSAVAGSRIYVGSLAGLIELDGMRVVRTYTTSNSHLSHDWVTALAEAEGVLYVGTNGGGVDAMFSTGEWVKLSEEVGRFEVNQNAMSHDRERVYVGTTDRGLLVYNTRTRDWKRISEGLPSQNVTAIASDDQFIYAGTLNGLLKIEKRTLN